MGRFLKKSLKFTVCFAVLVLIYTVSHVTDIEKAKENIFIKQPAILEKEADASIKKGKSRQDHQEGVAIIENGQSEHKNNRVHKEKKSFYKPNLEAHNTNCAHDKMLVPNIIHWTWFYDEPKNVSWMAYISMLSAVRIQKPDIIYTWCTESPVGKYWNAIVAEAKSTNTSLRLRRITPPSKIFNITIEWKAHQSDIVRLQKLSKIGGIYMDLDVIIVKNFVPLMCYEFTLGRERDVKLNNGIVLSAKNARFINHWFDLYRNYDNKCWDCQSVHGANNLAALYPDLLHIEQTTMNRPGFGERQYLYSPDLTFDWSNNYCVHTWYKAHKKEYDPESIRTLDLAIGELFRFIYYGSSDKIY